jgi:hypothetical protein
MSPSPLGTGRSPGTLVGTLVILPGLLAALTLLPLHTQLKFLLFPPLAALRYRVLRNRLHRASK